MFSILFLAGKSIGQTSELIKTINNPGTYLGNSSSVTINSYVSCPHFFLKLTVTGSQGTSVSHIEKITTSLCAPCINQNNGLIEHPSEGTFFELSKSSGPAINNMMLYPNPTTGHTTLEFTLHQAEKPMIFLSTMTGVVVKQIPVDHLNAGMQQIELSLGNIPSGTYQLTLHCNGYRASRLLNKFN
ncbi:MAG TPA: T9SS type A sorting domain-containing protein [Saprospiraceae bacterium]|nr:T9SS type A sorting domain-containing protein [Saprospiraceae bacterium]HMQ84402.1 T9SS type A sorting domain-containing protein [Saprospiraceae bacterium]